MGFRRGSFHARIIRDPDYRSWTAAETGPTCLWPPLNFSRYRYRDPPGDGDEEHDTYDKQVSKSSIRDVLEKIGGNVQ